MYVCETQHQSSTTSKYSGVSWNQNLKKWYAQLAHNKKKYYGGYFDNEEYAAMEVNLLCDKYEIQRKNATIDIDKNIIQQVMHSLWFVNGVTAEGPKN